MTCTSFRPPPGPCPLELHADGEVLHSIQTRNSGTTDNPPQGCQGPAAPTAHNSGSHDTHVQASSSAHPFPNPPKASRFPSSVLMARCRGAVVREDDQPLVAESSHQLSLRLDRQACVATGLSPGPLPQFFYFLDSAGLAATSPPFLRTPPTLRHHQAGPP